jgi:uncharacterized protein
MLIRPATESDFDAILALNAESVQFLSPLNEQRLAWLHSMAAYHRVIERDQTVIAFLLAFREQTDYDSPNYLWFIERYKTFLYVDRVVISLKAQASGLGSALYKDIIKFGQTTNAHFLTCEYDSDPPNPVSAKFHQRFGFAQIGSQQVAHSGGKTVSMQCLAL